MIGLPRDRMKRRCSYCKKRTIAIRMPCRPLTMDLVLPTILLCGIPLAFLYAVWWGFGRTWYCTVCGTDGELDYG